MKTYIKTKDLSIGYNGIPLLPYHLNLSIAKGQMVGVFGKNGIGKSSLLKAILGVGSHIYGEVFIKGNNLKSFAPKKIAQNISVVFTDSVSDAHLTVFDTVALGRYPHINWYGKLTDIDKEKIENALAITELQDIAHKKLTTLSDGQKQRVMISRALVQDTPIILLDEPTAHLDLEQTLKIFNLLKNICQLTQKTILISTHEINIALKQCHNFLILDTDNYSFGNIKEPDTALLLKKVFSSDLISYDYNLQQFIY